MIKKDIKGFTLVEIMVVIVIMGILAAVAVPKLFGSVARAKAAEIAPAAGTYQKLQDLYLAEKGYIGAWSHIGYIAPGSGKTNNFTYCGGEITEDIEASSFGEISKVGWQATNNVGLNDCSAGHWWFVSMKPESTTLIYYATETNATECVALAKPSWTVSSRTGMSCGTAGSVAETALKPTDVGYTMTMGTSKPGGWAYNADTVNLNVNGSQYSTYNKDSEDGLFKLEGNSTYEFTIEVSEDLWDETNGKFLQTLTRVYSEQGAGTAAIVCGSVITKDESDPNQVGYVGGTNTVNGANGYNTGNNNAKAAGYTAEAKIEHVTNEEGKQVVKTTVTLTTGAAGGGFGANFYSAGGWTNAQRTEAQNAIEKSTLTLVDKKDNSTTSSTSK